MFDLVGQSPALQAVMVVAGTFVLEDAATVLTAVATRVGTMRTSLALGSLYAGIVLGDLGLYGLGRLSAHFAWARRLVPASARQRGEDWLQGRVFTVVFVSRFIPGARLPTYTACGFLDADLKPFLAAAVVATSIWTSLLFGLSLVVGEALLRHLGAWRWAGVLGFVAVIMLMGRAAGRWKGARP